MCANKTAQHLDDLVPVSEPDTITALFSSSSETGHLAPAVVTMMF